MLLEHWKTFKEATDLFDEDKIKRETFYVNPNSKDGKVRPYSYTADGLRQRSTLRTITQNRNRVNASFIYIGMDCSIYRCIPWSSRGSGSLAKAWS